MPVFHFFAHVAHAVAHSVVVVADHIWMFIGDVLAFFVGLTQL